MQKHALLLIGLAGLLAGLGAFLWLGRGAGGRAAPASGAAGAPAAVAAAPSAALRPGALAEGERGGRAQPGEAGDGALAAPLDPARAGQVAGWVSDDSGGALEGVSVRAFATPGRGAFAADPAQALRAREVARTRTDADGRFALQLELGVPHEVRVEHPGAGRAVVADVHAGAQLDLQLEPAASLVGTVRRAGAALPGVRLRGFRWSEAGETVLFEGTSDAAGEFRFGGLTTGDLWIDAHSDGLALPYIQAYVSPSGIGNDVRLDVAVPPLERWSGRLVDALSQAPIAGARVGWRRGTAEPALSDAQGAFALQGLADPDAVLAVEADGYCPLWLSGAERSAARGAPLELQLAPAASARGRVVDASGRGLSEVEVTALRSPLDPPVSAHSAADGAFEIAGIDARAPCALLLRAPGYGAFAVELPAAQGDASSVQRELGELVLPEALVLSGRVIDESGAGWSGLELALFAVAEPTDPIDGQFGPQPRAARGPALRALDRRTRSDELGRFTFGGLAPGSYLVCTTAPGLLTWKMHALSAQSASEELRLWLAAGSPLAGSVWDPWGKPVEGARVELVGTSLARRTDEWGRFRFLGLEAGEGLLEIVPPPERRRERPRLAPLQLRHAPVGRIDLDLVLPAASSIKGRVQDSAGRALVGASVEARSHAGLALQRVKSGAEGAFEVWVPAEGSVQLDAWSPSAVPPLRAHLPRVFAGEDAVVLRLPAQGAD
jgi:hypothetical protein